MFVFRQLRDDPLDVCVVSQLRDDPLDVCVVRKLRADTPRCLCVQTVKG